MAPITPTGKNKASGFTYLGLLFFVTISGIAMAGAGITWKYKIQTAREKELLFVGNQYRKAIESYYESSPNGIKRYPTSLDELLVDKRFPFLKRHLRKAYLDPITKNKPWQLIKLQDQIIGISSTSSGKPFKKSHFPTEFKYFEEAKTYKDWTFIYQPNGLFR